MAAPMEKHEHLKEGEENGRLCELQCTVVTGFEDVAKADIEEKLGCTVEVSGRGNVTVFVPFSKVLKVLDLQSVGNVYVVLSHFKEFKFGETTEECLQILGNIIPDVDWEHGLQVWSKFIGFKHPVSPNSQASYSKEHSASRAKLNIERVHSVKQIRKPKNKWKDRMKKKKSGGMGTDDIAKTTEDNGVNEGREPEDAETENKEDDKVKAENCDVENVDEKKEKTDELSGNNGANDNQDEDTKSQGPPPKVQKVVDPNLPSFRVSCYRSGEKHIFESPQVSYHFGGCVQDYFGWNVNLKNFDIEVVLNIEEDHVYVAIALTKESQHRRHIRHFGPTVLKPTIAYNMLRMCEIKPGDVVCDPMAGGGSIPIEAAVNWKSAYHLDGDIDDHCYNRANLNVQDLNTHFQETNRPPISVDILRWDVTRLPLKDNSVDVFITDLPFGKRSGSKVRNWHLYPKALTEMARVSRLETGRACLLTHDKKCIIKSIANIPAYWRRGTYLWINIGGLAAGVYMLHRTNLAHSKS